MPKVQYSAREIHLEYEFNAPASKVWEAWTNPELLGKWAWGSSGELLSSQSDLRIGGLWSVYIKVEDDEGWPSNEWGMSGYYVSLEPGKGLTYTLHWDAPVGYNEAGSGCLDEVVCVSMEEIGGKTTMHVKHMGVPDDDECEREHKKGILNCLDTLSQLLTK